MKRVVVNQYGGPEVVTIVDAEVPVPGPGEVRVKVLAAGVSFTDSQLRAGTYLGGPKPPFTPGYELVGVVEALGPGCTRLGVGDRVGSLTVWGADAERVCVPEAYAVDVPEDLDPAEVVSLVFPYMSEDFLARVQQLTADGVDIVLDPIGGAVSLRSFRALRPGGRLVVYGRHATIAHGKKNWPAVFEWYAGTAAVAAWGFLSARRHVLPYRIQKLRTSHQDWFREDFHQLLALLRQGSIHPIVAQRLPLTEARHAHEILESTAATGKLVLLPQA